MRLRSHIVRIGSSTLAAMAAIAFAICSASEVPSVASAATTIAIPDCQGTPQVRPASITLACGDGGLIANGLMWTGWGETFAAARGIASENTCTPNCAQGHYVKQPIVLIADGQGRCPDGRPAYARLTVAWPAPSATSTTLQYPTPCGRH